MQTELKPAEQQEVQELEAQAAPETEVPAEETNAPSRKKKKEKEPTTLKMEIMSWIVTLVAAVVFATVIRMFIFEPIRVDGNSMYPTLHDGEFMYVSKLDYGSSFFGIPFTGIGTYFTVGGEPERFDVVVCNYPNRLGKHGERLNFVKRLVGLPGDTVAIRSGFLYVNGEKYDEPFLAEYIAEDFGPYTVPEGYYFVMGDNRNNSNDSRATGPITRDMIVGEVKGVIWRSTPATLDYEEDALRRPHLRK